MITKQLYVSADHAIWAGGGRRRMPSHRTSSTASPSMLASTSCIGKIHYYAKQSALIMLWKICFSCYMKKSWGLRRCMLGRISFRLHLPCMHGMPHRIKTSLKALFSKNLRITAVALQHSVSFSDPWHVRVCMHFISPVVMTKKMPKTHQEPLPYTCMYKSNWCSQMQHTTVVQRAYAKRAAVPSL